MRRNDTFLSTSTRYLRTLLLIGALLVLVAACAEDAEPTEAAGVVTEVVTETVTETVTEVAPDDGGAIVPSAGPTDQPAALTGTVFTNPDEFLGTEVQVDAQVVQTISDQAFTIAADDWGGKILHVVPEAVGQSVPEGAQVRVIGVVEEWDERSVEDELGVELDDDVAADFDGENYIRASQVTPLSDATESAGSGQ